MRFFIKRWLSLLLIAAFALAFAGCSKKLSAPKDTAAPSKSPVTSPSQNAQIRASDRPSASPTDEAKQTAQSSEEASEKPGETSGADSIEGFMEGSIVKPEDAPALVKLLAERSEYKDMSIQSITYKLYDGRQAYYVVLQGEGEASHPIYVFADDTIIEDDMGQ